ncbi:MAG: hypothetical protein WC340_12470 [Kiritimatiellia bacterium]
MKNSTVRFVFTGFLCLSFMGFAENGAGENALEAGFSQAVITPWRGLSLAGYFNPRPNEGVLDDLHVKCILFRSGDTCGGFVTFDTCKIEAETVENILLRLKRSGFRHGNGLIVSATHAHTAPYTSTKRMKLTDPGYMEILEKKTVETVLLAERNFAPATLRLGVANNNPYAYNRRYWMKNGKVTTNPGKLNPEIVKPEGPVDCDIGVLAVEQNGRTVAIIANIVNHTDTIGLSLVSADWPGRLARTVQNGLGYDLFVMTLVGCSGNINHFDTSTDANQTQYAEACRIGKGYGEIVLGQLKKLESLEVGTLSVVSQDFAIPFRVLPKKMIEDAKELLARVPARATTGDQTSEGLAKGDDQVLRYFAERIVDYPSSFKGKERVYKVVTLAIGDRFAATSLPGEPFTEIGLEIKEKSPIKNTWPVTLAMGYCGYVPLAVSFENGGYEIQPCKGGSPREDTAARMVEASLKGLRQAAKR